VDILDALLRICSQQNVYNSQIFSPTFSEYHSACHFTGNRDIQAQLTMTSVYGQVGLVKISHICDALFALQLPHFRFRKTRSIHGIVISKSRAVFRRSELSGPVGQIRLRALQCSQSTE